MSFTVSSNSGSLHRVAIALGSNIGDRQSNLAAALHKLRSYVRIERISSVYETKPVGFTDQPDFLNMTCTGVTDLAPRALRDALAKIERQIGRRISIPLGPRAIDLDLLLYDDLVTRDEDCTLPHPGLPARAFVLVPLAEIAPELIDPLSGKTVAELAAVVNRSGVVKCESGLLTRIRRDVQESRPVVPLSLNRAGISGVKTLIAMPIASGVARSALAVLDVYADLDASKSGVHMSRFSQDLEDALAELTDHDRMRIDDLAVAIAHRVVDSQRAERAEVLVRTEVALDRVTPASARPTKEFYTLLARAVVTPHVRRSMLGVEAEGMTACPCAQSMMTDHARERLAAEGFNEAQVTRILGAIPMATHNQRGRGTFMVGTDSAVDIPTLVEIVEQSMSSETYDLLKRPDELFIVNKAHQTPRFVEDVVREMLRYAHDVLEGFTDETFVMARQINYESIHKHDAIAESCCTLGELRRELAGEGDVRHTTLEEWLYAARPGSVVTGR